MKHFYFTGLFLLFFSLSFGQHDLTKSSVYHDAIKLSTYIGNRGQFKTQIVDGVANDKYFDILLKYSPFLKGETEDSIKNYYRDVNPYLKQYILKGTGSGLGKLDSRAINAPLNFESIGNTDVTKYADALAQFMVERAQAELTVAFFEKFKKFTEEHSEIKTLFPNTCDQLITLNSVHYRQMLNVLRNAFESDLEKLPDNLIHVVATYADNHQMLELSVVVKSLNHARQLQHLSAPDFIASLTEITNDREADSVEWYKNLNSGLELTAILSNAIRDSSDTSNWIRPQDFYKNVISDTITKDLFFGLLYQQILNDSVSFNGTLLSNVLSSEKVQWMNAKLSELVLLTHQIDNNIKEITSNREAGKPVSNEALNTYISTTLDIAEFGNEILEHFANGKNLFGDYINMAKSANDIYRYTYEREYSTAISETIELLKEVYAKVQPKQMEVTKNLIAEAKEGSFVLNANNELELSPSSSLKNNQYALRYVNLFNASAGSKKLQNWDLTKTIRKFKTFLRSEKSVLKDEDGWLKNLSKFGVFMANLVKAESAESAKAVIEAAVLPVGSSTLRKKSIISSNISSYLGAGFDLENNFLPTVTAPIGIDFAFGLNRGGSVALNVSLLDIGAIVDYRLADDSTSIESTITLGNIFSPGAQLVYGLPYQIPLAIGIGAQYGPGLTGLSTDGLTLNNKPQWRAKAFIAVDMPLFNFYNKQRRKL